MTVPLSRTQKLAFEVLIALGLWPHEHFTYSPFKILEFRKLVRSLDWTGQERVLDIGCGGGLQTFLIGRLAGHTTGLDIDPEFIEQARWYGARVRGCRRVDFETRHLGEIGYPQESFDRIFSICVLEHIPEHREILAECQRILKPGGEMVFSVDTLEAITDHALKQKHMLAHHVVHYYTRDGLRDILTDAGFVDIRIDTMFRSELARELFVHGIEHGFNFGRLRASRLASQLEKAEQEAPADAPGIFLVARARAPQRAIA
jgi:SAM-dependent methyltransferase